ncbi:MAG TPA: NADH:flavin oxidoreductase/NADH oxidase [Burkholderiales bacterium]|jgi:2,4-dienoyl-CoA reductase-like NADH-dependent reductase (Old Yellow Enzyme family)
MPRHLFSPITLGGVTLPNRIVVSPMCQYSADDGSMNDWHFVHLGHLAYSGAGLVMVEATHVTREGRITHGCTGLYSDHNEASIKKVIEACRRVSKSPFGIQIGHAGRKASTQVPWQGREALGPAESPWPTVAPSPLPFSPAWHTPKEMFKEEILQTVDAFVASVARARRIGFDVLELHSAHGYLLHQFLSPISNRRSDEYGRERMKFPLQVARAVREAWPKERALGARISAHDWVEGGLGPDDAVAYARELERVGFDYVCVSSGGLASHARLNVGPGYQLPFAEKVKQNSKLKVRAVGMIADPDQAEAAIAEGKADMVAMARAFLDNPRWVWHAAERFGVKLDYPPQYARARHDAWPGSKLARPSSKAC